MKYSGDMSIFLPGYDYINIQLKRLEKKMACVCKSDDDEDVHQSRTSCRRLLSGMDFFKDLFDKPHYKLWRKKVCDLLTAMGDARDLDVQILYLEGKISGLDDNSWKYRAGLNELLQNWQDKRLAYQPVLVNAISMAKKDGFLKEIRKELKNLLKNNKCSFPGSITEAGIEFLHARVEDRVKKVKACEDCLAQPDDKMSHHNMRIKAKKLRYTLELSDVVMGGVLESFVPKVKKIQTLLGEVHDCDVWEERLASHLSQEHDKVSVDPRYAYLVAKLVPGQEYLLEQARQSRIRKFSQFKEFWSELEMERFWQSLEDVFGIFRVKDIEMKFV